MHHRAKKRPFAHRVNQVTAYVNQALAHAVIFTIALGPGAARPPQGEISIAAVQPELVHPTPAAIQCEVMF